MPVQTDAAVGTAVSSMQPVLVGGRDTGGNLQPVPLQTHNDGIGTPGNTGTGSVSTIAVPLLFNESAYDRQRGNTNVTLLSSAARTATTPAPTQTNYNGRGVHIVLDITAASGTGGLTLVIEAFDVTSGKWYTILQSANQLAIATVVLKVYPGLVAVANSIANDIIHRFWRVRVVHGDATSYTYSVGANLVV